MKKAIIFTMAIFALLLSCSKDKETTQAPYVDTDYYPGSSAAAKQEVLDFLKTTKHNPLPATKSLEEYQDRELSEAKWILEAAGNYLTNDNLPVYNKETEATKEQISLTVIENGANKYVAGTELTSEFNTIFDKVVAYETTNNVTAYAIDFEIKETVNSLSVVDVIIFYSGGTKEETPENPCDGIDDINDYVYEYYFITHPVNFPPSTTPSTWYSNVVVASSASIPNSGMYVFGNFELPINDSQYPYFNPNYYLGYRYEYLWYGKPPQSPPLLTNLAGWQQRAVELVHNYIYYKQGTSEFSVLNIYFDCGEWIEFPYNPWNPGWAMHVEEFSYGIRNAF